MIAVEHREGDAPEFTATVEKLVNRVAADLEPRELVVIKLDNWFGFKWLKFSGKVVGAAGAWNSRLTVPPFVPNRVVSEEWFYAPDYLPGPPRAAIHTTMDSGQAVYRLLAKVAPDAALVWFSGESVTNGRGALMAYLPVSGGYWTWYSEWTGGGIWQPTQVKGISRAELDRLVA